MSKEYDLHLGKEIWKELEKVRKFGYSNSTIFNDFIDTCVCSLLSLTDNMQHPDVIEPLKTNKITGKYQEQYMNIIAKYKENENGKKGDRPCDFFTNAWGLLVKETMESQEDVLGEIFTAKISFGEHGQFFTPSHISDLMAELTISGNEQKNISD